MATIIITMCYQLALGRRKRSVAGALEMSVLNPMIGLDFDSTSFYEVSTTSTHKLIKKTKT